MTTEQAVKWLKDLNKGLAMPQYEDALDMAIQALQAQTDCNTCDKAVRNRVGVIGCAKFDSKPTVAIPSAIGHWIGKYDGVSAWYECDRCHTERAFNTDYCPDCGCRMIEEQEVRDK